jgi:hypothetical protein
MKFGGSGNRSIGYGFPNDRQLRMLRTVGKEFAFAEYDLNVAT